jgi:hypothetical protein
MPYRSGTCVAQKGSTKGLILAQLTPSLLVDSSDSVQAVIDPRDPAESAGLRYVSNDRPGIRRKKAGTGFTHTRPDGLRSPSVRR